MGMFDYVRFECACPKCGANVTDFQTKDGDRVFEILEPQQVNQFYSSCQHCRTWIEFNAEVLREVRGGGEWRGLRWGLESERRLLGRQVRHRFGPDCAARSAPLLEALVEFSRFEELGEVLLDSPDAAAWLERLRIATMADEPRKFVMTFRPLDV